MSEMNRIYYNKLVRDNIPGKIEAKHIESKVRKITDVQETQQELFKKIRKKPPHYQCVGLKSLFLRSIVI